MEVISKQEKSKSHQEFQKLLTEDLGNRKFKEGEIAIGTCLLYTSPSPRDAPLSRMQSSA